MFNQVLRNLIYLLISELKEAWIFTSCCHFNESENQKSFKTQKLKTGCFSLL